MPEPSAVYRAGPDGSPIRPRESGFPAHDSGSSTGRSLHLPGGAAEADHVLLKTPPGFITDALFFHVHRNPIVFPQARNNPSCGDECVAVTHASHRSRSKNARSLAAEYFLAQGGCLEVDGVVLNESGHRRRHISLNPTIDNDCMTVIVQSLA